MKTARVNEVLAAQIAIIKEYAVTLEPKDLEKLSENLMHIERAVKTLREYLGYLPS